MRIGFDKGGVRLRFDPPKAPPYNPNPPPTPPHTHPNSQDIKERVFGATDAASAMSTILARDPSFDMSRLLAGVKKDAPLVGGGGWKGFC